MDCGATASIAAYSTAGADGRRRPAPRDDIAQGALLAARHQFRVARDVQFADGLDPVQIRGFGAVHDGPRAKATGFFQFGMRRHAARAQRQAHLVASLPRARARRQNAPNAAPSAQPVCATPEPRSRTAPPTPSASPRRPTGTACVAARETPALRRCPPGLRWNRTGRPATPLRFGHGLFMQRRQRAQHVGGGGSNSNENRPSAQGNPG